MGQARQLKIKDMFMYYCMYTYIHIPYICVYIYIYVIICINHTYFQASHTHNLETISGLWLSPFPERCARHLGIINIFLRLENHRNMKSLYIYNIRIYNQNVWIEWQYVDKPWNNNEHSVFPVGFFAHPSFEVTVHRSNLGLAWFYHIFIGQFFMTPSLTCSKMPLFWSHPETSKMICPDYLH